jgi:AcrR family transcriptional regulator
VSGDGGLRERKKTKMRRLLESASLDLFERRGFERTSIADIADATETSPRTVFRYFDRKEQLIFRAATEFLAVMRSCLARRPSGESSFEALHRALSDYAAFLESRKDVVMRSVRIIDASPALKRRQSEELHTWRDALVRDVARRHGDAAPRLEHTTVVLVGLGALAAAFGEWIATGGDASLPGLLDRAFAVIEEAASSHLEREATP